jgi:hypothetical protein
MRLLTTNLVSQDATVITASSEDASFPASNLKHPFRSKRWRTPDVDGANVVFDMVTSEAVDSVAIFWPKETGILLSDSAVLKIQANATNVWTSPAVDITLTINNTYEMASHYFSSDQSYRYWRVTIEDDGNPNDYLEIGVVYIGKSLSLSQIENGFGYNLSDTSQTDTTPFGHVYTDEYPIMQSVTFEYKYIDESTVVLLENAFRLNRTTKPVLVVVDADEDVFDKDHYCVYGLFAPKRGAEHIRYNLFNDKLVVTELS